MQDRVPQVGEIRYLDADGSSGEYRIPLTT